MGDLRRRRRIRVGCFVLAVVTAFRKESGKAD
jgi:hypothetical protein